MYEVGRIQHRGVELIRDVMFSGIYTRHDLKETINQRETAQTPQKQQQQQMVTSAD